MKNYCQRCGNELEERRQCTPLWLTFYECKGCYQTYLEVADPRWVFPLQFLELGTLKKALQCSQEQLAKSAAKIEFINYKTVSIIEFERALSQGRDEE